MSFRQLFQRPQNLPYVTPPAARWPLIVGLLLGVWLSWALYAGTLSLPFLQEDSFHIRWMAGLSPLDTFLTARGAPDYRPLGKAIIKAWYLVLDEHNRAWLRFHNLVFNALNIALVALLATWADGSRRRYWTAGIAALLFGTLPFAYQAVPWINNFFYPLANLLLLMMTAVYWQARLRNDNRLLALALFLCFLAPFEIEYGLMASSLLFTVELVLWLQKRQAYPWLTPVLIGLALNLLFLARSLTIPKDEYAFGLPTPGRLLLIGTYFLQGLMYPIAPLAQRLVAATGMGDVAAIWLVCLPVLLVMVAYLYHRRARGLLALSLLWFVLLNLPALVFVDFDYVVNSPRLLYPPGVGIALLWGGFLAALAFGERRQEVWRAALVGLFLAGVLWVSVDFVRGRLFVYDLAERPSLQLAEIARTAPPDEALLIVNFPSWLSPAERVFAMGNHGAQIIPFYINIQDLIYAFNDVDQPARAVQFANIRQPQPYYYGMLGEHVDYAQLRDYLQTSGDVYVTQWGPEQLALLAAGRVDSVDTGENTGETPVTFGAHIQLTDAQTHIQPDGTISATLSWRIAQRLDRDVTVFVHLYGPDGQLITQADGYPLRGLAPFWLWENGQTLHDHRTLTLPPDAPPGPYSIGIGLYDPATGRRMPATGPDSIPLPDDVLILPLPPTSS